MNSDDIQPGFWKRLERSVAWILKTTLVTFILIGILGGLAWGGILGFKELQRSFNVVSGRIDANQEKIYQLQVNVNNLEKANPGQQEQIDTLQTDLNDLDTRLTSLQETIAADLGRQQQLLTTLEEDVATAVGNSKIITENVTVLSDALVALQGDVNENGRHIDSLGGEIDEVRAEITTLDTSLSDLYQTAASTTVTETKATAEMSQIQQTLALFRVWELITRARLRLVENNVGLAMADTELALRAIDALVAVGLEGGEEPLQLVQARLALAYANLPDNPATAVSDLENAWDELDKVLATRLLPGAETSTPTSSP